MRSLALLLLVLTPAASLAQGEDKITCRFIALKGSEPPELVNVGAEDFEAPVKMRSGILSPDVVCAKKGNTLQFVTADDRKPAAQGTVPAGVRNAILVFGSAGKNPGQLPWRVFIIEDSPQRFPNGGAYVANFHSQNIRFIIGGDKVMLQPAGSRGFPQPKVRDDFNMAPVIFQFQNSRNEWTTARETMLRFTPGLRYLMFAYLDPVSRRPSVTTVKDFKQHAAAAKP